MNELNALKLMLQGGIVMIPIIILSMVSIFIIIERWMFISKRRNKNPLLIKQIAELLHDGNIKSVKTLCEREQNATSKILYDGIETIGRPVKEIESIMETSSLIELSNQEERLNYLGLIAGIAPMLGFIGTISGVIKIFYNISLSDNISIGIIAGGLYEKMISSGAGLIVGVIAYSGYHLLSIKIDKNIADMQKSAFEFIKIIQKPADENK
jgi:biopolymer transport protein ExbB